jgi:cellulose synthase/poly-beta-1,6-N-acetylglucosamine synthase-like glycosyltransferase
MKSAFFALQLFIALIWLVRQRRVGPARYYGSVDVVVPAYNEELCIAQTVEGLLANPYFRQVIVVNDGSTDRTAAILDELSICHSRLQIVHQENTGKGGALAAGISKVRAPMVFLTDADTLIPVDEGIGYLIAEIKQGADAVGGIPASNLEGAGLLPHIRATVKLPMIAMRRTFQQVAGGAPFLISGACGLFRTTVLRRVPFSDRTKVEDLDMTWTLVGQGYRIRQSSRCIVYSQECNSLKAEWLRWRRWIIGYAVCMRLHRRLLLTRFGLFTILPMFLVVGIGVAAYAAHAMAPLMHATSISPLVLFPVSWLAISGIIASISALHYGRLSLVLLAPTAVLYVFLAYAIWLIHGTRGLVTGREPQRDKPTRYAHVVA